MPDGGVALVGAALGGSLIFANIYTEPLGYRYTHNGSGQCYAFTGCDIRRTSSGRSRESYSAMNITYHTPGGIFYISSTLHTISDMLHKSSVFGFPDIHPEPDMLRYELCIGSRFGISRRYPMISYETIQFNSIRFAPPQRGDNAHRDARLAREMRGLTSIDIILWI